MSSILNGDGPSGIPATKDEIIKIIRDDIAQRNMQELVQTMHEGCFKKCISQPTTSLSSGESACISQCVQKYMSVLDVTSKQWNKSINEMKAKQGSGFL